MGKENNEAWMSKCQQLANNTKAILNFIKPTVVAAWLIFFKPDIVQRNIIPDQNSSDHTCRKAWLTFSYLYNNILDIFAYM